MCGLIGALLTEPKLTNEQMEAALARIGHRGPDNTTYWFSSDRRMALGHVRLSIIGLVNGDQPLVNVRGDVRCVVNGEFYGYKTIRAQLAAEGVRLSTDTDSEIALHLYEKYGAEFVHHLRGEFAVIIADERRRCLIAARDRFGIKPLFYTVVGDDVVLASEIKGLLALGAPARWDTDGFLADCHAARPASRCRVQSFWLRMRSAAGFAREKSKPRNGAGEIFMTAAAEIARETVSVAKGFEHETGKPLQIREKIGFLGRQNHLQYQVPNNWLGDLDSNQD